MIRAVAGQSIGAQMINAGTGAAFTGAVSVYVTGDAGTQAIGSVGGGACTHEGNGFHTYRPAAAETDYASVAFTFVGAGAVPATVLVDTLTSAEFASLASGGSLLTYSARDLIEQACYEINALAAGDTLDGTNAVFGLSKLTRLFDNWNVDDKALYADSFTSYAITPALQPHTIGQSAATWVLTVTRPQKIDAATLVIGTTRYPLTLRDADWWDSLPIQGTTGIPTDLYYNPTFPDGSVYLWPVPTAANSIELMLRAPFAWLALTDIVSFPPGYLDAIILTLAESLATPFEKQVSPQLALSARQARARIFDANDRKPTGSTTDSGLGGGGSEGSYLTGWWPRR